MRRRRPRKRRYYRHRKRFPAGILAFVAALAIIVEIGFAASGGKSADKERYRTSYRTGYRGQARSDSDVPATEPPPEPRMPRVEPPRRPPPEKAIVKRDPDYEKGLRFFFEGSKIYRKSGGCSPEEAQEYIRQAREKFDKAREHFDKALDRNPDDKELERDYVDLNQLLEDCVRRLELQRE